jgi:ribonuclease P protein component
VPKYRHSAVERNRLKRRMRELIRQILLSEAGSFDLTLKALPDAYAASFDALRAAVNDLAPRISTVLRPSARPS